MASPTNAAATVASYIPQQIQDINTVMGIAGFFITLVVMFQVRLIRMSFRARARLPQINKDIQKASAALNLNLTNWPTNKNKGHAQIKIASSLIEVAIPLVPRASRRQIAMISKKLKKASRDFSHSHYDGLNTIWDLYTDIHVVIANLKQIEQNLKWE